MFDGMKIQDVTVSTDALLTNDLLTFGALVDPQTGAFINPIRRAISRGLTFRLVPRRNGQGDRVEVKGSLHKFHNNGQHNADQFTAADLLLTLDQLVTNYGFDPFRSKVNNIEFGVNVVLPFPVVHVLQNLLSYKNRPFTCDTHSKTPYYECRFQQFTVKLYDKGKQKGLDEEVLRAEIKVSKMAYFNNTGVKINTLADLLNVANHGILGRLLVDTFNEILFDDPTINPATLTARERETYQNGRNPRFWQSAATLPTTEYNRQRKSRQRTETSFRALLDQHRQGENLQSQTATLIAQTWQRLSTVSPDLQTAINDRQTAWRNLTKPNIQAGVGQHENSERTKRNQPETCPELTGFILPDANELAGGLSRERCPELTDVANPELSPNNPLYSEVNYDTTSTHTSTEPGAALCPVTGVKLHRPKSGQRFVSAEMLRHDDDLLMRLNSRFSQYAKGSKEDEYTRTAHNTRNAFNNPRHNPRNNLKRSINKIHRQPTLFDVADTLRLTADQRAALDYGPGTRHERQI